MTGILARRRIAFAVASLCAAHAALAAGPLLSARGPLSPVHPFPLWYQDANGVQAEPCLAATGCILSATGVNGAFSPLDPIVFPSNFPTNLVYGYVNVDVPVFDQASGKLQQRGLTYTAQLTALFPAGATAPAVWTELSFVTPAQFLPNKTYTIDHPYGTFTLASDATGNLCANQFQGGRNPCVVRFPTAVNAGTPFDGVLGVGSTDPAAGWTFLSQVGAPPGLLGDGVTRGGITGSPFNQNFIRISGPGVGTSAGLACTNGLASDCIEVGGANPPKGQGFVVAGKKFAPAGGPTTQFWITDPASASPAGAIPRVDFATAAGTAITLTIRAVDVNGNLTAGYSRSVLLSSNDPGAVLPGVATLTNGVGTFTFTPHRATAGALTSAVTATDGVLTSTALGVVNGGPATALLVTPTSPAVAGAPASFTVQALDRFGNLDAAFAGVASLSSSDSAATVPPTVSLALGQGAFTATFRTAGSVQVTADGGPLLVPGVAAVAVTPGPAASIAAVSGSGQVGPVGGALPAPFTLVVKDAFGNGVPGVPVTFSPPAGGSVSPAAATTGAGGVAASTATLPALPGVYLFTAASGALLGTPVSFAATAVHGPPAALAMVGPSTAVAGAPVTVALALADAFGNPCTTTAGSVAFATADPAGPPPPALVVAGLGSASMTFHQAGPQTLGGVLVGAPAVTASYGALVSAGQAVSLTVTGLPSTLPAGVAATVALTARDAFQNVATGLSTAVTATSTDDPSALLPAGLALASGAATAQVAFRTTGTHTVTFTTAGGLTVVASATVTPAALAAITAISAPTSGAVGTAAGAASFELRDTLGNVVPGRTLTFGAPAGGGVSPATAITDAQGRASTALTLPTAAGSYPFTASLGTLSASVSVSATPGPGHHLALTAAPAPGPVLDCGCYDLVAQLRDAFGNAVPSALGGVTATTSAAATLQAPTDLVAGLAAPSASVTGALQPDGSAHLHVCDAVPEHATLTVSAPGASPAIAPASQDLSWTLGPADPGKTAALHLLTIDHATLVAWSGRGHLAFTPVSACGNHIGPGQPVTFALNGPGTLTPVVDAGDGSYTATLDVAPCPASGGTQVVARVGGVDIGSLPVAVTCDPPDLVASSVSFSRRDVSMCNDPQRDAVAVTVTPRDAAGQLLGPGNTVVVAMDGLVGGAVRDAGDGTFAASFTAASCGPGPRPATVSVDGVDIASVPLTFTCSPVDAGASGVHVTGKAVADGAAALTVVVAATNGCGEPAAGRPVTLTSSVGALAAASGVTDAAGTFTTGVTATSAGQGTVSATVDGVALAPAAVSFDPKPKAGGCGTGPGGDALALLALLAAGLRRTSLLRRKTSSRS